MVTTVAGTPGLVLAGLPQLLRMDWGGVGPAGWGALAYATLLSLVLAYLLWNRSVQAVGASRTVIFMCLTPLVAVAGAAVMLGERPRPLQAVGAILILAGVLLVRGREDRNGLYRRRQLLEPAHGPAQVRDDDAASHYQSYREDLQEFLAGDPFLVAPDDMVRDAVVAAEHQR